MISDRDDGCGSVWCISVVADLEITGVFPEMVADCPYRMVLGSSHSPGTVGCLDGDFGEVLFALANDDGLHLLCGGVARLGFGRQDGISDLYILDFLGLPV